MTETPSETLRHAGIADVLRGEIGSGRYAVGSPFPSEAALQRRFGVGRHTVREALKALAEQGLLGRRKRAGTTVTSIKPSSLYVHSLRDLRGLLDFAQSTVLDIRHKGFGRGGGSSPFDAFEPPDSRWYRVAGVRSSRGTGQPLCWSEIIVPVRFLPDHSEVLRGEKAVYEIVMKEHGLALGHVEQEITAHSLSDGLSKLLDVQPAGGAALMVKRRYVDRTGRVFEISHNLYPADRYSVRSVIRQRV